MKTMKPTFIMGMLAICMGMMSCQDDEDTNISTIKPGTYSADIIVNSESGSTNYSRGIDVEKGIFTSTYEQNYIYLHHVNADGNGETGEALYIPMRTDCGEDKCFNIQVTKNKNGDNISYTIITEDEDETGTPQSMTINENEQIYFSTMKDKIWKSEILKEQSPIGDILKQPTNVDDIKSREILRSGLYTGERLLELMTGDTQYIDLTRHVTGFKINILFTNANVVENEDHIIDLEEWHNAFNALGEDVNPEDFFIKIYFGPNFAQWYNILNNKSEGSGYYASNNETYASFEEVKQTYNNIAYTGYGYNTTNTLLSPLYIGEANKEFRIYMCIKYKEKGQEFYTEIRPKNLTMNPNTIHHMILAFDVHDLIPIVTKGGTYSTRSSSSTFQKIDIKPIKVICN